MSSSSPRFVAITNEFPEEGEALGRLAALIDSGRYKEMTLDHLLLSVRPRSTETLVRILERLAFSGVIHRVYRVESPGMKGPIEDFQRYEDIPRRINDWHTDTILDVTPRDLQVIYTLA